MFDYTKVQELRFEDLPWYPVSAREIIQKEGFGAKVTASVHLQGRGPFLIRCKTGAKPEMMIRLGARVARNAFGPAIINPVFADNLEGNNPKDYNSLFLSEDGEDQWPVDHMHLGQETVRGQESSLVRDSYYYFMIPGYEGGHQSIVGNESTRVSYTSLSSDEVAEFEDTLAGDGELVTTIGGVSTVWVRKNTL